jgi:AraC-like DNA-binding protein
MDESLAPWNIALAGFGAALGLFFAASLATKQPRSAADPFLAAFCATFGLLMAGDVLALAAAPKKAIELNNAFDWAFLLLSPLFYFYVTTSVSGKRPGRLQLGLGLLPALLCWVWFAGRWALAAGEPALPGDAPEFMPAAYSYAFVVVAVVQLFGYTVAAYRRVRTHARAVEQRYSSVQQRDLRWVQSLIWWAGAAALVWVAGIVIQQPVWAATSAAVPPLMLLALGVLAQRQGPLPPEPKPEPPSAKETKYAKSGLTGERMQALAEELAQFMAQEKAFLEGDLTLGQLASRTGVPQHQLSQVLNQHLGCSFFEYVNKLRVEEVKRCLADPAYRSQSVLELGMASGFNSKAAFNAAFKRLTGVTPVEYRSRAS